MERAKESGKSGPKRVALVGAGGWGKNLARSLKSLRGAVLAAVCDRDREALDRLDDLGPETDRVRDFEKLVEDPQVEGIVVSTPPETHHDLALRALRAGKDVLVEKPLALRPQDAAELVRVAEGEGRILMVGHLLLYHPAIVHLEEILGRGELGAVRYLYSQRVNLGVVRRNENVLWSLAPHDVAVAIGLLREIPDRVAAQGAAFLQPGIEDVAFLHLFFPSGRMAAIHVSWLDPRKERRLTVVGSQQMAVFNDMDPAEKLRIYDRGVDVPDTLPYGEALTPRFGDIRIPALPGGEPLRLECQHFVDRMHDRACPRTDGHSGLAVVRVLAAASESLRRGGATVEVRP